MISPPDDCNWSPCSGLFSLCTLPPDQSCWKIELIGSLPAHNLHWAPIALTECSRSVSPSQCNSWPHGHLQAMHSQQRALCLLPEPLLRHCPSPLSAHPSQATARSFSAWVLSPHEFCIYYIPSSLRPSPPPPPWKSICPYFLPLRSISTLGNCSSLALGMYETIWGFVCSADWKIHGGAKATSLFRVSPHSLAQCLEPPLFVECNWIMGFKNDF